LVDIAVSHLAMNVLTELLLAYIDPGAGGYIFQLLIAGLMGAFCTFASVRSRVAGAFRRWFAGKPPDPNGDPPQKPQDTA
jgi:hypothetical protein